MCVGMYEPLVVEQGVGDRMMAAAAERKIGSLYRLWSMAAAFFVSILLCQPSQAAGGQPGAAEPLTISTDVLRATLDPVGATIVRVELLRHDDRNGGGGKVVLMDRTPKRQYVAQTGVLAGSGQGEGITHVSRMLASPGLRELADGRDELEVRFESEPAGADGTLRVSKVFTFRRNDYTIGLKHEVTNGGASPMTPAVYLQFVRDGSTPEGEPRFSTAFVGPAIYSEAGKYNKVKFSGIEKAATEEKPDRYAGSNNGWVAMVQHYFVAAWVLGRSADDDANSKREREFFTRKVGPNLYAVGMLVPLGRLEPGGQASLDSRLYVGPQDAARLANTAAGFDQVKDYGVFAVLSGPMFWVLSKLHDIIGNWGWAVVGLVVILKIVFYGLNGSAYRSLAKMSMVNPKIAQMRELMKDQPQLVHEETMRIYREHGISPAGGCLPILLQIPFFIALYWVLLSSVEMRNAPWVGWITDLSASDPFFVLPVLMAITSVIQTRLNPPPADPTQAVMMWAVPLIFSAMFLFLPAGLVLFWLTNNVLSIAHQTMVNRAHSRVVASAVGGL